MDTLVILSPRFVGSLLFPAHHRALSKVRVGKGPGDCCDCCDVINFKAIPLQENTLPYVSLVRLGSWGHGWQCEYNTLILFFPDSGCKYEHLLVSLPSLAGSPVSVQGFLSLALTCVKTLSKELQLSLQEPVRELKLRLVPLFQPLPHHVTTEVWSCASEWMLAHRGGNGLLDPVSVDTR